VLGGKNKLALFGFVFFRRRSLKILIFTCHKRAYLNPDVIGIGFVFSNSLSLNASRSTLNE
jgi:hypothetical protein